MSYRRIRQLRTADQWLRCDHDRTFVDLTSDLVTLGWQDELPRSPPAVPVPTDGAGLAIDSACRVYRSVPSEGRVEVVRGGLEGEISDPADLLADSAPKALGDFTPSGPAPFTIEPRAMVVDDGDRLFIVDRAHRRILVVDLWAKEIVRRVSMPPGVVPLDLATDGHSVTVLASPPALYRLTSSSGLRPHAETLPPGVGTPSRVTRHPDGRLFVLDAAGTPGARVFALGGGMHDEPNATDIAIRAGDEPRLVIARAPGEDFLQYSADGDFDPLPPPLRARGYDGRGVLALEDGAILYFGDNGYRRAAPAPVRFEREGRVVSYLLDAESHRTQWGRVLIDACLPPATQLRIACITLDDLPEDGLAPRRAPVGLEAAVADLRTPELSPTMPPASRLPPADAPLPQLVHRRASGAETPWCPEVPGYETYEAPVDAPAGRYLWIVLGLEGNGRRSPKIRAVRAEFPSHDLVAKLPRLYARDRAAADFLRRYLGMFDSFLHELELSSALRNILLDPHASPEEALPWLASFVGLVLDERLSEAAKRTLVEEAVRLWRFRGTPAMLERLLEIATGTRPLIVERFRLRGVGGIAVGADDGRATSVLGVGMRVGGRVGTPGSTALDDAPADAFALHAHRFTVMVPTSLDGEQRDLAEHLIATHKPAHTLFDLCTVDEGMRVGLGLHVGLSSIVGHGSNWARLTVGQSALGRDGRLGRPRPSLRVGGDAVGKTTRLG